MSRANTSEELADEQLADSLESIIELDQLTESESSSDAAVDEIVVRVKARAQKWSKAIAAVPLLYSQSCESLASRLVQRIPGLEGDLARTLAQESLLSVLHAVTGRLPEAVRDAGRGRLVLVKEGASVKAWWLEDNDQRAPEFDMAALVSRCVHGLGSRWAYLAEPVSQALLEALVAGEIQVPSFRIESQSAPGHRGLVFRWLAPDSLLSVPFDETDRLAEIEDKIGHISPRLGLALDKVARSDGPKIMQKVVEAIRPAQPHLSAPLQELVSEWSDLIVERMDTEQSV